MAVGDTIEAGICNLKYILWLSQCWLLAGGWLLQHLLVVREAVMSQALGHLQSLNLTAHLVVSSHFFVNVAAVSGPTASSAIQPY